MESSRSRGIYDAFRCLSRVFGMFDVQYRLPTTRCRRLQSRIYISDQMRGRLMIANRAGEYPDKSCARWWTISAMRIRCSAQHFQLSTSVVYSSNAEISPMRSARYISAASADEIPVPPAPDMSCSLTLFFQDATPWQTKKMRRFLLYRNSDGLTPLSLCASIGNPTMFHRILNCTSPVAWEYGPCVH